MDKFEAFQEIQKIIGRGKFQVFEKTAAVYSREVQVGHVNVCRFGDFVESNRGALATEVLSMNPRGHNETWFSDRENLYTKTDVVGHIVIDGVEWEVREPNDHPDNTVGAFQYDGRFGEMVEFFKPRWNTCMSVKRGGYIAFKLNDPLDIWSIKEMAMDQLYVKA